MSRFVLSTSVFAFFHFWTLSIVNSVTVPPLGSSPLPTINFGCVDDTEGPSAQEQKFYNETCQNDSDCYSSYSDSVVCKNGHCDCTDGYLPEKYRSTDASKKRLWFCAPLPGFNDPCTTKCDAPYSCSIAPAPTNLASVTPDSLDLPVAEPGKQRFCICKEPFKIKNSGRCELDCKSDEFYYQHECRKRCQVNEIQNRDDGTCRKTSTLGQQCQDKRQCITPFADCLAGKCACSAGFKPNSNNDACDPMTFNCPFGDPLKAENSIVRCGNKKINIDNNQQPTKKPPSISPSPIKLKSALDPNSDHSQIASCPDSHFCLFPTDRDDQINPGHCCLKPRGICPIGEPHPNATCDYPIPANKISCPVMDTHNCHNTNVLGLEVSACCPIPCGRDLFQYNGRCYAEKNLGDKCEINQQCDKFEGKCENGICTCRKGYQPQGDPPSYCSQVCGDYETTLKDTCVPLLKLGDKCDDDQLCPVSAHCSKKKKVCVCQCGYGRLDDKNCGLPPTCNFTETGTPVPTATGEFNITGFTFCQIPASTKQVANEVRQCPKNQYCADYKSDLGVCCPRPEKILCLDGSTPTAKCDPNIPKNCGGKGDCYKYINIANPKDATDGHVCCYHK